MAGFLTNIRTTYGGSGITFTLKGWKEFSEGMSSSLIKFSDSKRMHARIGINFLKWIDKNFREEGTERKWPPLSPTTIKLRRKGSSKPLQDKGLLRRSFIAKPTSEQVAVGTKDIRSSTHEKGRFQLWGNNIVFIPQRKMLPSRKAGMPIVRRTYDRFVKKSFRKVM
jgi:phage gpG-like protein